MHRADLNVQSNVERPLPGRPGDAPSLTYCGSSCRDRPRRDTRTGRSSSTAVACATAASQSEHDLLTHMPGPNDMCFHRTASRPAPQKDGTRCWSPAATKECRWPANGPSLILMVMHPSPQHLQSLVLPSGQLARLTGTKWHPASLERRCCKLADSWGTPHVSQSC